MNDFLWIGEKRRDQGGLLLYYLVWIFYSEIFFKYYLYNAYKKEKKNKDILMPVISGVIFSFSVVIMSLVSKTKEGWEWVAGL